MSTAEKSPSRPEGAAWADTVSRSAQKLYKTALAVTGSVCDAEDAVQETFVRLIEAHPAFLTAGHETAWLIRVCVNICKNKLSSAWRRKTVPLTDTFPAADEAETSLMEAVARLPGKDRAAIHLFYYEGYSTTEIAAMTGQRESTARSRLSRARRKLKDLLGDET